MDRPLTRRSVIQTGIGAVCGISCAHAAAKKSRRSGTDPESPSGTDVLTAAEEVYRNGKKIIQAKFRKELARSITMATSGQACLLDFEPSTPPKDLDLEAQEKDWFPIVPYQVQSKILKAVDLQPEQQKKAASLMAGVLNNAVPDGGAFCHYPIHGLRFYRDKWDYYFTSFCWVCSNFFIQFPDDHMTATWLGLPPDDGLEKWLKALLPIPQGELKRFKEQYKEDLK
jgi:hypothetical protein